MNKKFSGKFRIGAAAVLLLPLFAHAASTVTLPGILPTTTSGTSTSSSKLAGTVSSLTATTATVTSLPQLPAATPAPAATSGGSGGIPLPGLEGLGTGSGLPIGKLPGIRPIRLPGPIPN